MNNNISGAEIKQIGFYLPEKLLSNQELHDRCGFDMEFLESKIGIKERHIASDRETVSFMAVQAINDLLCKAGIGKEDIELLLLCTQNPDYRLPTTACIVQNEAGLTKKCLCFDINLGCSGFVYALRIAGNFIELGQLKHAIIVTADQYTKYLDQKDRNTIALFGDAAAATLLGPCSKKAGILYSLFGTDGSGARHLIFENSAVVRNLNGNNTIFMNGREIFKFAVQVIPQNVKQLVFENGLQLADVRYFIFHQANQYILNEIKQRLCLNDEQVVLEMDKVGNTVSSTIPIAFDKIISKKVLRSGDFVVFCGFGVGLSWGSILYKVP